MERTGVPNSAARDARRALADLLGAISYALLHSFQVAARGATQAPSIKLAEQQAHFAVDEFRRYEILRARLAQLTEDVAGAMEVYRDPVDAFYASATGEGWIETQVFHFIGDTITTDFAELLCTRIDAETADVVRSALTGRTAQEAFALEQIGDLLDQGGAEAQARVAGFARTMLGSALNRFRDALFASNTVEQVLGGPDAVKECVLELLGRHRERLERLGLEQLD